MKNYISSKKVVSLRWGLSIEKFKYYSHYTDYRMTSTIQLSKETKHLIGTFGSKEDTYEDIIKRMYKMAVKEQLRELLMTSEDTISISEAREELNKKWSKSR